MDEWGNKKWKYIPFIFEVTLKEDGKHPVDAIYRNIKISIGRYTFWGCGSGHIEKNRYTIGFHSADFKPFKNIMGTWSILASEIKSVRQKVERLQSVYESLIEPNLRDGDKRFYVDCISTPFNKEEGFVIPSDENGEVA